jgi:molybdate transport system substrate-binding protein
MKANGYNYAFVILIALTAGAFLFQQSRRTGDLHAEPGPQSRVVVFAAAGLTLALQDCAAIYEQQTGCKVELNLASSAVLARQIEAGADWDAYVSANRQWMDYLLEKTGQSPETVTALAADRLALVSPADAEPVTVEISSGAFAKNFTGRLALGDPQSVPVGIYAKQTLEKLGWWDDLSDNVIPAVNVSAAQRYVEAGQCELGIIYLSGAKMSSKVNVIHVFEESLHEPIRFLAAAKDGSALGREFLEFLTRSPQAAEEFARNGFEAVTADGGPVP